MQLEVLKNEEKLMNFIMFLFDTIVPGVAFVYVMLFNGGTWIDAVVLLMTVLAIFTKILEIKLGGYAKYFYISIIPAVGAVVIAVGNDGVFGAMVVAYFLVTLLSIPYYNFNVIKVNAITTIVPNALLMIYFPSGFLKMYTASIWVFIVMLYALFLVGSVFIARRTRGLFSDVEAIKMYEDELVYLNQLEKKEEKYSEFIHNLSHYFKAIGELARDGHCAPILKLTEELNLIMEQNERIIYINHKVVNAILSEKGREALEKEINFDVYVEPGSGFGNTADCDLVAMIGNLMDNAIEAAGRCTGEKRKVVLRIFMEKEGKVCVVKIVNYFVQKPQIHKSGFVTSKREKGMHGIGVRSVKNTVEKYGGCLQCLVEEECFTAILVLPVQKTELR